MQVLLVDDHRMFLEGVSALLKEVEPGISILTATSIAQAIEMKGAIDLILLDLHLPDAFGFNGIERLRFAFDAAPIVVVSSEDAPPHIEACIRHGAMGFVPKSSSATELISAMKRILGGQSYLPQYSMAGTLGFSVKAPANDKVHFTARQREVLMKVIQGKINKVIARELGISETTVKTHVAAVLAALGATNRTEAVYHAASLGIELR
jgi:two-component system, NarL family, nitrate/nitrite response regulator NarL